MATIVLDPVARTVFPWEETDLDVLGWLFLRRVKDLVLGDLVADFFDLVADFFDFVEDFIGLVVLR